jgi:hypothetical protein
MIVNHKLETMRKEAIVILFGHFSGEIQENHEKPQDNLCLGRGSIREPYRLVTFLSNLLFVVRMEFSEKRIKNKNKLRGLSPQANYTDRATAACVRS